RLALGRLEAMPQLWSNAARLQLPAYAMASGHEKRARNTGPFLLRMFRLSGPYFAYRCPAGRTAHFDCPGPAGPAGAVAAPTAGRASAAAGGAGPADSSGQTGCSGWS